MDGALHLTGTGSGTRWRPGRVVVHHLTRTGRMNCISDRGDNTADSATRPLSSRSRRPLASGNRRARTRGPKEYRETEATPNEEDSRANGSIKSLLLELYKDRRFQQENTARMFENYRGMMEGLVSKYETRLSATENVNQQLLNTHLNTTAEHAHGSDQTTRGTTRPKRESRAS
jgi:hypothetical protein